MPLPRDNRIRDVVEPAGVSPEPRNAQAFRGDDTPRKSRLWLWIVVAFALQAAAWTAWFIIAAHHQVAEVPLAGTASEKP